MGIGVENCSVVAHTQPGRGYVDYKLRRHHANLGIDDESPGFDQSAYNSMKAAAAQSQSAFDSAATTALGSWYSGLGSAWKQGYREDFLAL